MARKRTGTLVWTGKQWSARFSAGPLIPLQVTDKRIARARMAELARGGAAPTTPIETFESAARRIVAQLETDGMVTADERLSRLERWAFPALGSMLVDQIKPGNVTSLLEDVASYGKSRQTIIHLRNDLSKIFAELVRDEVLPRNPAKAELIRTPRVARDDRPRTLLTDDEFAALVSAPTTPVQLAMMAIASRGFGGMRTSDLHAWTWTDVDLVGWAYADVPRPKTERGATGHQRERIELPPNVAGALRVWWEKHGRPTKGPVFPQQRHSYARPLRSALRAAGVTRPELHKPSETSKPVDFHSFRRAFVTAVGAAGLNAQTAMRLTGHRTMATHMRYNLPETLQIPQAAVPRLQNTTGLSNRDRPTVPPAWQLCETTQRPQRDLNPCYRRERPVSKFSLASKCSELAGITDVIDLNSWLEDRMSLQSTATQDNQHTSSTNVVDSELSIPTCPVCGEACAQCRAQVARLG